MISDEFLRKDPLDGNSQAIEAVRGSDVVAVRCALPPSNEAAVRDYGHVKHQELVSARSISRYFGN